MVFAACLFFAVCYVVNALPMKRYASSGGIPVRIVREGNNQMLSVSSEGLVFSNGSNSEMDTCLLLVSPDTNGRLKLASSQYEGLFIGITADGMVKAAPKSELYASTFQITSFAKTSLQFFDTDVECTLGFNDDGTARNACFLSMESGSGTGSEPITTTNEPDLFTFSIDYVCL